jgi:hypothetical protein
MRRYNIENPYEKLKELTRGKGISPEALQISSTAWTCQPSQGRAETADPGQLHRQRRSASQTHLITADPFETPGRAGRFYFKDLGYES